MKKLWGFLKFLGIAFLVILVLSLLVNKDDDATTTSDAQPVSQAGTTSKPTATPRPAATPKPTATPLPWLTDDFAMIRANSKDMTDAQWDAYVKTLPNHLATWTGWIQEVKSSGEILVDMDPPEDTFSVQDCYIHVPKENALKYSLDQKISWTGTVKSVTRVLGSLGIMFKDETMIDVP